MRSIYEFSDYRQAMKDWIRTSKVKGFQSKLAQEAGMSSSLLSLILKGDKNLSLEQATGLAEYFGFNDDQTHYFFLLVDLGKAGSEKLRAILKNRALEIRTNLSKRVGNAEEVTEKIKSTYYSNWTYTGLRNLIAIPGDHSAIALATKLRLPVPTVMKVLNFLKSNQFLEEHKSKLSVGQRKIHIDKNSIFVHKHHSNWRLKAISEMGNDSNRNIFFTSPMSLSAEAAEQIRTKIPKVIEEIMEISGPSDSEEVYCLNIDWFTY